MSQKLVLCGIRLVQRVHAQTKVSLNEDKGLQVFQEAEIQGSVQKSGEAVGDLKISIKYLSHASLSLQCFHLTMHYMKGTGK